MIDRTIVIVGAGPAGMSAAIAAAEAGLEPTVIDENSQVGGQIYRQPPAAFSAAKEPTHAPDAARGAELRRKFESFKGRIELLKGTTAWGLFPPKRLAISGADGWEMIQAEHLILATGAYEYVPPFPGWTLPGVMTPGGAQVMVKSMRMLPGRRILLAGTGPFLLVVAQTLHQAGADVVGIVEAAGKRDGLRVLSGLVAEPGLLLQGWRLLRQVRRAGIPIFWRHVLLEAQGDDETRQAVYAPCDAQWHPDRSRPRTAAVDTLCVGYGFVPRSQLAQLAGCRMRYADELGGWIPQTDDNLQTSVPGIWAAGDGAGVAGSLVAEVEGTLAGLAVAHQLGALERQEFEEASRPVRRRLAKLRRFRAALDRVSRIRPGLSTLANNESLVCRCEELSLGEIETGIAAGGTDIRTLKVMSRLGMGPCQGRMCWPAMARYLAGRTGRSIEEIGPLSIRPPVQPLTVGALADGDGMAAVSRSDAGEVWP
ncbi:MAG: NAD(P)/FAD-dependent oxidoreductase [Pirellulales bacterium]